MKLFISITLSFFLVSSRLLIAQLDPAAMAALSKLSPEQRQQLQKRYGSAEGGISQSAPAASIPNRSVKVEKSEEESFKERSEFLGDLNSMERMISADVSRLQSQLGAENSSNDNELLEALEESKALLRKIKELQRKEIEKRAEEFGNSESDAIKPFGYDLFASDPSTFAPGNEVPIPSDYRIGPGDLIEIQLFGQRNESFSLSISREGMIRFPGIGPIHAFEKGTSFLELKNHLKEKIKEHLGEGAQSEITLGAFRSMRIFLLGEVRKQGAYTVSALSTTINALLSCGGIKETGSLRNIQLKRGGKIISTMDLYDLLLHGDTSADHSLQPGDVIFVPVVEKQISISGAVRRPAKFEIRGGETLQNALELAGGVEGRAYLSNIRLERLGKDFRPIVKNLSIPSDSSYEVLTGDVISLGSASSKVINSVSLLGNVERPGEYEWRKGLTLGDLIHSSNDLLSSTDLTYGLIRRKLENGSIKVISFAPAELFDQGAKQSVFLEKQDAVFFFSNKTPRTDLLNGILNDLRRQSNSKNFTPVVNVSGLVRFPGEYPLVAGMNLSQLLDASGGLLDAAYTLSAEITRLSVDDEQQATVKHLNLDNLDDLNFTSSLKIHPYDHLHVKKVPYWTENLTVTLSGEFIFPGTYQILRGETVSQLVARAGGLTDQAFAGGAVFSRENLRKSEEKLKKRLISQLESDLATVTLSSTNAEESAQARAAAESMLSKLRNQESQGRLVIDLDKILDTDVSSDLLIKDGDILFIPTLPYAVSVSGEVQFPSSHLFKEKLDVKDYIYKSGGYTQNADEARTFVVKADGSVLAQKGNAWFGKGSATKTISAGDVIVVPIDLKQTRWLENLTYSTQIIYQLAVAAAAVNSF
jgi:protein involved in polysaccharide export with SLBB domain